MGPGTAAIRRSPAILSRNPKREVLKVIRRTLGVLLVAGLAASCSRKPASIEVSPRPVKMFGLGRITRLTGRAVDKKGQPVDGVPIALWASKAGGVKVDGSGKPESLAEGKSIVTASFEKLSMQIPVEVLDIKTIEIAPVTAHLVGPVGTTMSLTTTLKNSKGGMVTSPVVWTSTNPKVAKVSPEGEVAAAGPGTTTIVAKVGDLQGVSEVMVTVGEVTHVDIHPKTALVRIGDSQKFDVVAYGPDGRPYEGSSAIFKSSDPSVAMVDSNGIVSGLSTGTTTIRATVAGLSAEATLLVN